MAAGNGRRAKRGNTVGLDVAIMIEGQDGLNWPRWQRLGRAAEDLGFAGLYCSDHFTNPAGPLLDSLELWSALGWLASATERIEFGPLVSPVSFRNPVVTAWTARDIDDLSGGRLQLGLGAGWQEREHDAFGFDLLDLDARFARFEEGLEVISLLLHADDPVSFDGAHYQLREAQLVPRPARPGGPPIVIGGNGPRRTLPLVARYADEWNAVSAPPDRFAALNAQLDELLRAGGRQPGDVRRSMMTTVVLARDAAEADRRFGDKDRAALRDKGALIGTPDEIVAGLGRLSEAGANRVMLRWLELDDLEGLEALAAGVLPQVN